MFDIEAAPAAPQSARKKGENLLPLASGWRRAAQPPEEGEASNEIPHGQGEVRGQRDATQKITKRGLGKGGEGAHRKEPAAIREGGNGNKERGTEERDARGNKGGARSGTSTTTAQKSRDADEDEGQASLAPQGKGNGEQPSDNWGDLEDGGEKHLGKGTDAFPPAEEGGRRGGGKLYSTARNHERGGIGSEEGRGSKRSDKERKELEAQTFQREFERSLGNELGSDPGNRQMGGVGTTVQNGNSSAEAPLQ